MRGSEATRSSCRRPLQGGGSRNSRHRLFFDRLQLGLAAYEFRERVNRFADIEFFLFRRVIPIHSIQRDKSPEVGNIEQVLYARSPDAQSDIDNQSSLIPFAVLVLIRPPVAGNVPTMGGNLQEVIGEQLDHLANGRDIRR